MSVQEIYQFRKVSDNLITGGQPTREQLASAAAEGFEIVINLATDHSIPFLEGEDELVRSLGMTYIHIPVEWENPQESDFWAFEAVMSELNGRKILIHCAANFRATAFYSLYALKNLGWSRSQAVNFRASVWSGNHYPIWDKFISEMEEKIGR